VFKVEEVYEKQIRRHEERPDGSTFVSFGKTFDTRTILLNQDYIVSIQPYEFPNHQDADSAQHLFPEGTSFCSLTVDGNSFRKSELVVVGSLNKFNELFKAPTK